MRYSNKDWIVIGFDGDNVNISPIIQMSGSGGLKKMLQGIRGKSSMTIYHVNFDIKTCIDVGNVNLPRNVSEIGRAHV